MLTASECRLYKSFVDRYQPYLYQLIGARAAREYGRRGGRIIDMGTGPGYLTAQLVARTGARVHAVDINPAMHELARFHVREKSVEANVLFDLEDVHALSYPDGFADMVVSYSCFHHWADPARALRECYRVLRDGGRLLLIDTQPGARAALGALRAAIREDELFRFVDEAIQESVSMAEVRRIASRAGIEAYTLEDFQFDEMDLVECLDEIASADAPVPDMPDGVATSWILLATRAESIRVKEREDVHGTRTF